MHRAACGRVSALREGSGSAREGRVAVRGRARSSAGNGLCGLRGMYRAACGRASGLRGRAKVFGGEWVMRSAGVRRGCVGERKCSGRACRCAGASGDLQRGMGGEGGGFNAHSPQQHARTCIIIYIRPPCPRREIAAMGPKDAFCEYPSPAKASAPAPSAFALPCPRSHFPRTAFRGPRIAIGIPQQQLSTMGYPRKSYPHRCPPPCAKRSRPRACARVYIIYRSPVGRSRGVSAPLRKRVRAVVAPCPAPPCAGWGGRRQRRTPPRAVPNHAACVPNHCVQRRSAQGQPRPCPCALPAVTCLPLRPAR